LDVDAAIRAVSALLDAVVPAGERRHPDLVGTPERVAEAWAQDLLDGYAQDPAALLSEAMPARGHDLVAVTGIDFHSMCPHHLLPSRGVAHVAYVPGERVVGFGQIARLVDCFAHRLVLEEDLARQVAEALVRHLGARGAACLLDAEQSCLSVRGERRARARAHAQCFVGVLDRDARLQARFLQLAEASAPRPSPLRGGARGAGRRPRVPRAPPPRVAGRGQGRGP
jgi:GTP cyclohydrolase IA